MASINFLIQQTLGGVNVVAYSAALSFQCNVVAFAFGFAAILSTLPIVHRSFIECECDPSHIKKDILETECLTGILKSESKKYGIVLYHTYYQDMPYLFVWFLLVNLVPALLCRLAYSKKILVAADSMKHFNQQEDGGRVSHLLDLFWGHFPDLSVNYVAKLLGETCGLLSHIYQIYYWDILLNGVFSASFFSNKNTYDDIFPQLVLCETITFAPGGERDIEEFKCILTMNRFYGATFKVMIVLYTISSILQITSLASHLLLLSPLFRR